MKLADALKRIEQLEARVRELEARPVQQIHHHYPTTYPYYLYPQVPMPQPLNPWPLFQPTIYMGAGIAPQIDESRSLVQRNPAPDAACGGVPTGHFTTLTIGGNA